jgi:hypothetical protein
MHALDASSSRTDPSQSLVLAADAPYLANLAALWSASAPLAAAIEALGDEDRYITEPSRSGAPTLALAGAAGAKIYLHSRFQPLEEAAKLVDSVCLDEAGAVFVHGFGLGYHVEASFDRCGDETVFFVLESDVKLLRSAFELRDYSRMIRSGRMHFFWEIDKSDLFIRLTPHSATIATGMATVSHAPSLQINASFHQQTTTWLDEFKAFCRTNINTLVLNGRRTAENVARNIGWYVATPDMARLKDSFKGAPAVIVSAGPSLRKNKHLLKDVQGKACIIAVQTTLWPLLQMGVEPQFVTSLDYHAISTRFWETLPKDLRTELVAEPKASNAIFDLNPGPLSLLGNEFAESLLAEMKLQKARLPSGATVAHLAYYLAEFVGCDPIIFIGQDLGFSDGLCYTPGTSYEDVWRPELSRFCTVEMKHWEQIVRDRAILRKVADYQNRPTYTEERLFTYLQQFERDFLRSSRKIIDATEGGVAKRGAAAMPFAQAIERYCTSPLQGVVPAHEGAQWHRLNECIASLEARREEAAQIERISADTLPLLEEVRDNIEDQPRVNRVISKLDALRAQMRHCDRCYGLIMQLTQTTELQRFRADRKIGLLKLSDAQRQRQQVSRDIDNVRGVMSAAKEFQKLMDDVISGLQSMSRRPIPKVAA